MLTTYVFFKTYSNDADKNLGYVHTIVLMEVIGGRFHRVLRPGTMLPLGVSNIGIPVRGQIALLTFLAACLVVYLIVSFAVVTVNVSGAGTVAVALDYINGMNPALNARVNPAVS